MKLVSPYWDTVFDGLDVYYECHAGEFYITYYLPTLGLSGKSGESVDLQGIGVWKKAESNWKHVQTVKDISWG